MKILLLSCFSLLCLGLYCCTSPTDYTTNTDTLSQTDSSNDDSGYYQEPYRLAYHFSPEKNWMNDPNGLVYYQGNYHLFYQYNPTGTRWGHMSWGHAVSKDLVHWEHWPVALEMEDSTMIFSGSAVVDQHNSSGLCQAPDSSCLVAIYTAHTDSIQNQAIAYSHDRGRTWTKYKNNPVLDEGMKDFRDPKVFWHEKERKWVMVVALPREKKVRFYESHNLIQWNMMSEFGPEGFVDGIWECPDLFELEVEGTGQRKWVLLVSYNADLTGSAMQYFTGDFDGKSFQNDNTNDLVLTLDYGRDFYAGVTWNQVPDQRRLLIGWFNNWMYANDIPTSTWRSAQSIVRELQLKEFPEGIRLIQRPIPALQALRQAHKHEENITIKEGDNFLSLENIQGKQLEIIAEFVYEAIDTPSEANALASEFGIKVFKGDKQETIIGYDVASQSLFVDRTQSGDTTFTEGFVAKTVGLMPAEEGTIKMHIFVDRSSIEVFGNDGYIVMSNRIFPDPQKDAVDIYTTGGMVTLKSLDIWELQSIWSAEADQSLVSDKP